MVTQSVKKLLQGLLQRARLGDGKSHDEAVSDWFG